MKKLIYIILLFFIATGFVYSKDCNSNFCNQSLDEAYSDASKPDVERIFSSNSNSFSTIENLEDQIIASVNYQVSKIHSDLSLAYRKKTLSIRYNMSNQLPEINSFISISYGKKAVSLNYTMELW